MEANMKPEELQRILDDHTMRQRGNGALYFAALLIAAVFVLVLYEGW
jgi:hypothetical protein